jgi:hypothetical protein
MTKIKLPFVHELGGGEDLKKRNNYNGFVFSKDVKDWIYARTDRGRNRLARQNAK